MEKKEMRCGYTTGSCVAAGAKAALQLLMHDEVLVNTQVISPQGEKIHVPIQSVWRTADGAAAVIIKDAGDDPDITNGISIQTAVKLLEEDKLIFNGGIGVGRVTKAGLSVPVGEPAINPGPRKMIELAVRDIIGTACGCEVTVTIPQGAELAKRTLNPILGVDGGLSILGTSGIVRPMSEEAFKNSLVPQISVAKAAGFESLVLVPGKIGQTVALRMGVPEGAIVQTSNFIGHLLEACVQEEVKEVLLLGHLGKLVKVAAGIFHTHNRMADARMETLAAYAASLGADTAAVKAILECITTEAAMPIISEHNLEAVYPLLAGRASIRAERYVFGEMKVGTAIVTLAGELLGMDENAKRIGGKLNWNMK